MRGEAALAEPVVRVVIVNYNAGEYLLRCIEGLLAQTRQDFEAVIVDNASRDGSIDGLPRNDRVRTIALDKNIGFAAANNLAARDATTRFLAFLNPDAVPEPTWLAMLLDAAARAQNAQLFGSLQLCAENPAHVDGAGDVYFFAGAAWRSGQGLRHQVVRGTHSSFGACAAAAMIDTQWFKKLGGFDEDYFCYFEDVDLAFRLRLLGGCVLQVNDAVVHHAGSVVSGKTSDFTIYHTIRNQIWTFVKNMPAPLLLALAPAHIALVVAQWVRAGRRGQRHVVSHAIWDAVRGLRRLLAKRRRASPARVASVASIARAMTWAPSAFWHRAGASSVAQ